MTCCFAAMHHVHVFIRHIKLVRQLPSQAFSSAGGVEARDEAASHHPAEPRGSPVRTGRSSQRTIMVNVLPLLVTPYAKTVPLRPSSVLRTTRAAAREYTCASVASVTHAVTEEASKSEHC